MPIQIGYFLLDLLVRTTKFFSSENMSRKLMQVTTMMELQGDNFKNMSIQP
jgi:hypothetical protein